MIVLPVSPDGCISVAFVSPGGQIDLVCLFAHAGGGAARDTATTFGAGCWTWAATCSASGARPSWCAAQAALVGQHCLPLGWHMSLWMVLPLHISARVWCTWMGPRGVDIPQATQQAEARLAQAWRGVGSCHTCPVIGQLGCLGDSGVPSWAVSMAA